MVELLGFRVLYSPLYDGWCLTLHIVVILLFEVALWLLVQLCSHWFRIRGVKDSGHPKP